jgi:hypothetical protein
MSTPQARTTFKNVTDWIDEVAKGYRGSAAEEQDRLAKARTTAEARAKEEDEAVKKAQADRARAQIEIARLQEELQTLTKNTQTAQQQLWLQNLERLESLLANNILADSQVKGSHPIYCRLPNDSPTNAGQCSPARLREMVTQMSGPNNPRGAGIIFGQDANVVAYYVNEAREVLGFVTDYDRLRVNPEVAKKYVSLPKALELASQGIVTLPATQAALGTAPTASPALSRAASLPLPASPIPTGAPPALVRAQSLGSAISVPVPRSATPVTVAAPGGNPAHTYYYY